MKIFNYYCNEVTAARSRGVESVSDSLHASNNNELFVSVRRGKAEVMGPGGLLKVA